MPLIFGWVLTPEVLNSDHRAFDLFRPHPPLLWQPHPAWIQILQLLPALWLYGSGLYYLRSEFIIPCVALIHTWQLPSKGRVSSGGVREGTTWSKSDEQCMNVYWTPFLIYNKSLTRIPLLAEWGRNRKEKKIHKLQNNFDRPTRKAIHNSHCVAAFCVKRLVLHMSKGFVMQLQTVYCSLLAYHLLGGSLSLLSQPSSIGKKHGSLLLDSRTAWSHHSNFSNLFSN